jgi:hypothetical protein
MTEIYHSIKLDGDAIFIKNTKAALDIVAKAENGYLDFVKAYVGGIRQAEKSGIHSTKTPPIFDVGYKTYTSNLNWYASAFVHEAYHSYLYRIGEPHSGLEAERRCMECQIGFLQTIGAPEYMTEYLRSLIDNKTDYFSDYKNRNW